MTVKTVENFLGVDIDYYIETDLPDSAELSTPLEAWRSMWIRICSIDTAQDLYIDIKAVGRYWMEKLPYNMFATAIGWEM